MNYFLVTGRRSKYFYETFRINMGDSGVLYLIEERKKLLIRSWVINL
jgi:hypothetical protein